MADSNIDIEAIMAEIRENIKTSGADKIPLSFNDSGSSNITSGNDKLSAAVSYVSCNYEVQPYELLTGNPIKVFVKKCIRKLGSFFFLPIVAQQNTLNYNFYMVADAIKDQANEVENLKKKVTDLEKQLADLKEKK